MKRSRAKFRLNREPTPTAATMVPMPPADEYNDHFHGGAAKAYRPVRLTGQYDHERIARTGA
mgnify:CR=1 FL=1